MTRGEPFFEGSELPERGERWANTPPGTGEFRDEEGTIWVDQFKKFNPPPLPPAGEPPSGEGDVVTGMSRGGSSLPPPPRGRSFGNGGDNGDMEQRLAAVEEAVARMDGQLTHIDREVSQTKWWVAGSALTIILAMVATVLGTGIAIQQMTVATFQGAAQQQKDAQPQPLQPPPIIINVPNAPQPAPPASR